MLCNFVYFMSRCFFFNFPYVLCSSVLLFVYVLIFYIVCAFHINYCYYLRRFRQSLTILFEKKPVISLCHLVLMKYILPEENGYFPISLCSLYTQLLVLSLNFLNLRNITCCFHLNECLHDKCVIYNRLIISILYHDYTVYHFRSKTFCFY